MKNALVTGAAGFIGIQIVKELLKKNYSITALVKTNNFQAIQKIESLSKNILIIDNLNKVTSNVRYDVIYHLATVGISPNFNNIELICDTNIKMSCRMVDFAIRNQCNLLVNFGSCFEYGNHGKSILNEDMDCRPESLYAISKNASTRLVNEYAKLKKVPLITVRPFGVFGEGEGANRLVPSIISNCLENKIVDTTYGEQIRDFVNVKDVAKAVILLSEGNYKNYEIYNICSNYPVTVKSFINEIVEVCGFEKSLINFGGLPYRKNEAMIYVGCNKKLQNVINYKFPNNHREGILDIYNSLIRKKEKITDIEQKN